FPYYWQNLCFGIFCMHIAVLIKIALCDGNFLSFSKLILFPHLRKAGWTAGLDDLSPDEPHDAGTDNYAGHDINQCRIFLRFNHQIEVDQNHQEDCGQANGGNPRGNDAYPNVTALWVSDKPGNDRHGGYRK